MTKKHFEAVAVQFRGEVMKASPEVRAALDRLAAKLALEFLRLNPRFDMDKFRKACGFYS